MLERFESREDPGGMDTPDPGPLSPLHAAIGLAAVAAGAAVSATRRIARVAAPLGSAVFRPPVVTERLHLAGAVDALADRGREVMTSRASDLERMATVIVPVVVREVLDTLDLNVVILERVDLDGLVAKVDIAEIIDRVDIDAVVRQVDLDAIVDRLNVVDLAEEVISEIDLPEIIRDSTGSMASHVVRDARMQSINADEAVAGLVDRLLRRRGKRSTAGPRQTQAETGSSSEAERQP